MSTPQGLSGKPSGTLPSSPIPQISPSSISPSGNDPQRRSGGRGGSTSGASAAARYNQPLARSNPSSRKVHRNQRRPNIARDEQIPMTSSGSRKGTSITHLINWNVAAPRTHLYNDHRPRNARRAPTWGLGSGYHAADKARYINSNYRFIVNPHGDYRAQAVDSDVHLPWDHVLQILASARTQCPNCPICLSTPVAPRMAKCGHIFCLPCLVRYMASNDGDRPLEKKARFKKCVICTDSVYMNDIRPVRFFVGQENEPPKDGGDVVLRLLMRKQGSALALPKDGADQPSELNHIPWYFAAEVMDYARVMKGTKDYMIGEHEREIGEVEEIEKEDGLIFGDEGDWFRKAVGMIRVQIKALGGMGNAEIPQAETKEKESVKRRPPIKFNESDENVPEMYYIQHAGRSGRSSPSRTTSRDNRSSSTTKSESQSPAPTVDRSSRPRLRSVAADSTRGTPYYFYQALPHYYLSPLDIRILKVAFGSFSIFPSTILPRVENVTTGHSVDDDLRKRAKYLAHLPYGCEVGFLECDWADIVPSEILDKFKPDIERRRKSKRERELKEERDRLRAEKLEDEERWVAARQRRRESTKERFPDEDFIPIVSNSFRSTDGDVSLGTSPPLELSSQGNILGSSFTSLSLASPSTSPVQGRTVWGTRAISATENPIPAASDNSGWRIDWERELKLGDDIMAQIGVEESMRVGPNRSGGPAPSYGKGQKKKFKKVTLMTNGGKRGA